MGRSNKSGNQEHSYTYEGKLFCRKLQTVHQLIFSIRKVPLEQFTCCLDPVPKSYLFFRYSLLKRGRLKTLQISLLCEWKECWRFHRQTFSCKTFPWRWFRDAVTAPFLPVWSTFQLTGRTQRNKKVEDKVAEEFKTSLSLVWSYEVWRGGNIPWLYFVQINFSILSTQFQLISWVICQWFTLDPSKDHCLQKKKNTCDGKN